MKPRAAAAEDAPPPPPAQAAPPREDAPPPPAAPSPAGKNGSAKAKVKQTEKENPKEKEKVKPKPKESIREKEKEKETLRSEKDKSIVRGESPTRSKDRRNDKDRAKAEKRSKNDGNTGKTKPEKLKDNGKNTAAKSPSAKKEIEPKDKKSKRHSSQERNAEGDAAEKAAKRKAAATALAALGGDSSDEEAIAKKKAKQAADAEAPPPLDPAVPLSPPLPVKGPDEPLADLPRLTLPEAKELVEEEPEPLVRSAEKQRELDEKVRKSVQEARERKKKEEQKEKEYEKWLNSKGEEVAEEPVEPSTLVPQIDRGKAPCDLPMWCVVPNEDDLIRDLGIYRNIIKEGVKDRIMRVLLGRRAWVLLGRRDKPAAGTIEPDIGLGSVRASRKHAVLFRNWKGQVFLVDLGSAHGSYLGGKKLKPHCPTEWKVDVTAFFADKSVEVFKLQDVGGVALAASKAAVRVALSAPPVKPVAVAAPAPLLTSVAVPRPAAGTSTQSKDAAPPLYPDDFNVPADGLTQFYGMKQN